jgi:hypothetical protein
MGVKEEDSNRRGWLGKNRNRLSVPSRGKEDF